MDMSSDAVIQRTLGKIGVTVVFALFLLLLTTGAIFKPLVTAILARGPHYTSYFEFMFVGLAPLILVIFFRENLSMYGVGKKGIIRSLTLGLSLALIYRLISPLLSHTGVVLVYRSFDLAFPLNLYYALLGIFAYGPLEAFFVVYLMVNVDILVSVMTGKRSPNTFLAGAILVPVFFGLFHIVTTGNVSNAVQVALFSCGYGLIYRYTGNSIGPMSAWTLANGWVQFLLVGCFT
ncbi:MAG TPA: CPBP family glutamic-type intramembrane protease [bacterium]